MASPHRSTAHSMTPMGGSTLCVGVLDCRPANGKRPNESERPTEVFMPRAIMPVIVVLPVLLLSAQTGSAQSFDIIRVADGVYAAIGKPGVFSNGAFIVNKDDVVVVDTHLRPSWARDLIAEIRKVTDKPVRYVGNTHWHGDHVQGNQVYISVFGKNVEYLAQHNTREDMNKKAIPSDPEDLRKHAP